MGRFNYTVQDSQGATTNGTLEATDENEAISALQGKGYFILSIQIDRQDTSGLGKMIAIRSKVGQRDLAFFGEQLATLLNGGVPLVRALSLLGEHAENPSLRNAIALVTKEVASGSSLYKAMDRQPDVFSPLWVALVQAGEMGGQLPKSLKQVARYIQTQQEMKAKVLTALMYPAVLGSISIMVLAFFIIKIVPTFAEIFKDFHMKLPAMTNLIITVSTGVAANLFLFLILFAVIALLLYGHLQTESGQRTKAEFLLSIPFFGNFHRNVLVERLLTTLSTLVESGVSILNTLSVLEGVFANNRVFLVAIKGVKNDVALGKSISMSFRDAKIFPSLVTEMMWMGEESGKLPEILSTLSEFYREQIDQFIRRFTAIIDPLMVIFVGAIVGVIVVSIFLPIFQLSQIGSHGG